MAAGDGDLVSRARRGDREAFGELVSRHQRGVLAIARAYFASEADAEDAVHDAFVRAFQHLHQLKDRHRFAAWVARITVNRCLSILNSKSDRVSLPEFASSVQVLPRSGQEHLTPATVAQRAEHLQLLKAAVGRLPEDQRVVIMLRYLQHMSYEKIAAYLDVPQSTLRWRAHVARKALRDALNKVGVTSG